MTPPMEDAAQLCDREPIHAPGAIQPDGWLIGLDDQGVLRVASENAPSLIGRPLDAFLGGDVRDVLDGGLGAALYDEATRGGGLEGAKRFRQAAYTLEVAATRNPQGLLLAELLPVDASTSGMDVRAAEAAIRASGRGLEDVAAVLEGLVEPLRRVMGFERACAYVFHDDGSGEVIAESRVDPLPSLFGLRFPGSDVPRQARALYVTHPVRCVADAAYRPVPLRLGPGVPEPVDLSGCMLRSVSPVHREYLKNLGVRASLSISLIVEERLWGMLLFHHRAPRRVSLAMVRALSWASVVGSVRVEEAERRAGLVASLRASRLDDLERLLIGRLDETASLERTLDAERGGILELIEADGVVIEHGTARWTLGLVPAAEVSSAIVARLLRDTAGPATTVSLTAEAPALAAFAPGVAGVMAVRFNERPNGVIAWYRRETIERITWAGDPGKAVEVQVDGGQVVRPRQSFEAWSQTVRGRSLPWRRWDLDAAATLRDTLREVVLRMSRLHEEVAKRRESERRFRTACAELESFAYAASHDLKEPLRGLSLMLERSFGALESGDAEAAARFLTRAIRSAGRMRSLADGVLRLSRSSTAPVVVEPVELGRVVDACFAEVLERTEPAPKLSRSRLPVLRGDPELVASLFGNLIGNAAKFHEPGTVAEVHVSATPVPLERAWELRVADRGVGLDLADHERAFEPFIRCHKRSLFEGAGLGLTICRRIVERHGGRIRLESAVGRGATAIVLWPDNPELAAHES